MECRRTKSNESQQSMSTKMDITMERIGSHEIQGNTRQARENARDEVLVVCRDTA